MNSPASTEPSPAYAPVPAAVAPQHVPFDDRPAKRRALVPALVATLALAPLALLALIPLLGIR